MVPVAFTLAGAAFVAITAAVGTGVTVGTPRSFLPASSLALAWGCAVGAAAGALALAAGADVGSGTAVAEDPQANSRATNSNTIAFGKFFIARSLKTDCDTFLPLLILTTFRG